MECDEQAWHRSSTLMFGTRDVVSQGIHLLLPNMKNIITLMTAWAWRWLFLKPQNPVFPGSHGGKCPRIHFGSSYFFQCHYHSCSEDAPGLAFDPNELWNMIVWTASGEIQEVPRQASKSKATMVPFHQGSCILTWTYAAVSPFAKAQQ